MTKCAFCGKEEHDFLGVHLIKNDGSVDFFCSSKCRKNAIKLKRDKRKLKWTESYREHKARKERSELRQNEEREQQAKEKKPLQNGKGKKTN